MYHLIVNGFSRFPRLRQRAHGESDWSAEDAYSMAPDPTSNFLESRVCYAPVLFFFFFRAFDYKHCPLSPRVIFTSVVKQHSVNRPTMLISDNKTGMR